MPKSEVSDLQFMQNDSLWPSFFLPLIRRINPVGYQCGLLLSSAEPVILLANLWAPPSEIASAERLRYSSFEAIIADHWVVD
jgi:hypothetical protein